jgi:mannose/fructose/N-acetylgalactosamine-specific phosphotransferase system component IIB
MIIANYIEKIKHVAQKVIYLLAQKETLISLVIVTTGLTAFILGFMAGKDSSNNNSSKVVFTDVDKSAMLAASIMAQNNKQSSQEMSESKQTKTTIFGSKSGTKYYHSWCKAGNRVKLENRIYFESAKQAEAAGRSLAASCI